MTDRALISGFLISCNRFPERTALEVDGTAWTYRDLKAKAASIAATLQFEQPDAVPPMTAVLAHRSIAAFAGILAALLRGHGYVPANPNLPAERTAAILDRSGCQSLIAGREALDSLPGILGNLERPMHIYLPDCARDEAFVHRFRPHRFIFQDEFRNQSAWRPQEVELSEPAYLLFTSGSTGVPKGVAVSHRNIRHFIDFAVERYEITEQDRFSQMFELVFDLSIFDMFVAWECGACLCCPNKGDAQMPARYINESGITIWFSVPSLAVAMANMRMLKANRYPKLRLSLFCGEALRSDIAAMWAKAAPNSAVENLYGPTEVTLACTYYRLDGSGDVPDTDQGLVPIGYPFPGMNAIVVDDELREVPDGTDGELLMSGPQVALGYWNDREKTDAAFRVPAGKRDIYYRTGDVVRRRDTSAPLEYRGRIDHQIKIRGNRIELGEIEVVLRAVDGVDEAVALGWPRSRAGAEAITAFVQSGSVDVEAARAYAESRLPAYMVPRQIMVIETMPLNQNGKIDRKALLSILESRT